MFDHKHYVPVLRWKMAEWNALRDLDSDIKTKLTPLIELVPKDFEVKENSRKRKSISQIIDNKVQEIMDNWGTAPFFIDFQHIENLKVNEKTSIQESFSSKAIAENLHPIPIVSLRKNKNTNSIIRIVSKVLNSGICLRIYPQYFHDDFFQKNLGDALSFFNYPPEKIDLIFDNQIQSSDSIEIKTIHDLLPDLLKWRTISLIGGCFPKDLTQFEVGEHELSRDDYLHWKDQIKQKGFSRLLSFGDYTVQYPFIKDLSFPTFSASIRYTSEKYWIIMRGQSVKKGSGYAQWPANASMLCNRDEFSGREFSKGDEYIYTMSEQTEKTGNARTWIQAGINHHLTFVVRQLASLFGS
jgi:hypothetical protein